MALDGGYISSTGGYSLFGGASRDAETWWWEPEPVRLAPVPARQVTPTRFDVLTGSFQFPGAWVDARAQRLVEGAKCNGERHTISLWRSALCESLERAAREAAHTSADAACVALFWRREGDDYRVVVTFEVPPHGASSRKRH